MGKMIVFEGIDGSGKGTQSRLLEKALSGKGYKCDLISFPQYEENFFGDEIGKYLDGKYEGKQDPRLISLLYALDRFESKSDLMESLATHDFLIVDRYVYSNIAHQGSFNFLNWNYLALWINYVEFTLLELPLPDLVFFLDIDQNSATNLIRKKKQRSYTGKKEDLHEEDFNHLRGAYEIYKDLSTGDLWATISCIKDNKLLSPEEIGMQVLLEVEKRFISV